MVGFGATFAESVMFPVAMKMGPRNLPYVHRLQLTINQFFAVPGAGDRDRHRASTRWPRATGSTATSGSAARSTIVVVIGVLLLAYFIPADRRLLPMVEQEIADAGSGEVKLSEDYQRAGAQRGHRRLDHRHPAGRRHLPDDDEARALAAQGAPPPKLCGSRQRRRQLG